MKKIIENWRLSFMQNSAFVKSDIYPMTVEDVLASGNPVINATVPGNFELDFIREGLLPEDIYFGANILEVQKLEGMHLWYFAEFELEDNDMDKFILFEGVDTAAEIFIDGQFFAFSENMLIPYEYSLDELEAGKHQVVVHIIPAGVYIRDIPFDATNRGMKYNVDSLVIRKAPYMYGWDIMPRTVSAGLWRPVSIVYKPTDRIEDVRIYTNHLKDGLASLTADIRITSDCDTLCGYSIKIEGACGESRFSTVSQSMNFNRKIHFDVPDPVLWWPKNCGEPMLYDVVVSLCFNDEVIDTKTIKFGIRTIQLERTSCAGENGTFRFIVNGQPIMVLGTNWVPTDAFPSRHDAYTLRALEMVNELNCNMIRCWGGNAYPCDELFDYCDAHGILVWQDFSMACGRYPNDERFLSLIREEAESVVKKFRNRASLALWSGDNECDYMYVWDRQSQDGSMFNQCDPNSNRITREVLPDVVSRLDNTRPYLPSSPYLDEEAIKNLKPAEDHLWGPRDYFKGDFYNKNSVCHFASETGYHGCPSPESLRRFIGEEHIDKIGDNKVCSDAHWLVHAASPEVNVNGSFAYRIPLMTRQVERIFDTSQCPIEEYALKSQISQAEAVKFFIEHFRIQKNYRWGILWWNIIDGWPQVSDAVVDWYGTKKLAYSYILRSQKPFVIMCDEPDGEGDLTLCAVNDSREDKKISYTVTEALTDRVVASGEATVKPDTKVELGKIKERKGEYYVIRWSGDAEGINHFVGAIGDKVDYNDYVTFMKKTGFIEALEGF